MTTIPNPPQVGDEFTNDATGISYRYDGFKWVVISTPESEDIEELTRRVAEGETVQEQIQDTIATALEVQERTLKKDESNVVTPAFRIRSDAKTFISTASGDLGLYNVADPTNPAHGLNLGYADNRYLKSADVDLSVYLPLSGGDMTGDINMQNCRFDTFNAAGDKTMEIAPSGFIKSRDMLRVVRDDGGPALEARTSDSNDDVTLKIDTTGNYMFTGIGDLRGDVRLRDQKSFIVRGSNNTNVGRFRALNDNQCSLSAEDGKTLYISNLATPFLSTDAANKGYVDGLVAPFVTGDEVDSKINNETVHLPLTGGTVDGTLSLRTATLGVNTLRFQYNNSLHTSAVFQSNSELRVVVHSGKVLKLNSTVNGVQKNVLTVGTTGNLNLYHLRTPTNPTDAATKGYVDEKVGQYGVPYKYRNTDTIAENLQPGEFFVASNGNAYFHPFDQLGRELVTSADQSHSTDVAGIFKVYDGTGKLLHQMAFNSYATGKTSNNYCRLDLNHTMRTKSTWSSTETYYLADGFLLPY